MRHAIAALAVTGCTGTEYVIEEGDHYSSHAVEVFSGTTLDFTAWFDESAEYTTVDPANQGDINKLYGFSDCSSLHHENSARFGWRWYDGELQIHAYMRLSTTFHPETPNDQVEAVSCQV